MSLYKLIMSSNSFQDYHFLRNEHISSREFQHPPLFNGDPLEVSNFLISLCPSVADSLLDAMLRVNF